MLSSQNDVPHIYRHEKLLHEIDAESILYIISKGKWDTCGQSITSAETNNDNSPAPCPEKQKNGDTSCGVDAFSSITFDHHVTRVLDVGGGKYDVCYHYMKSRQINLLIFDPYNRSSQHNAHVKDVVIANKVDAATSISVLNVIPEPESRLAHISTLKDSLHIDGKAYFKIWPGEGELKGTYMPIVNAYGHSGFQANSYPDRFLCEVEIVFGIGNASIIQDAVSEPNLIIATKKSEDDTSIEEICLIQEKSKDAPWLKARSAMKSPLCFQASQPENVTMNSHKPGFF